MLKDIYTVKDIAEQLQVKEKAVRHLISTGELKAGKICNKWIITAEDFKNFIESKKQYKQQAVQTTECTILNDSAQLYDALRNRDFEKYKQYIDFDNELDIGKDAAKLEFDSMCRSYHKEWKNPNEFLSYRLSGLFSLAGKYNVDPANMFSALSNELERRRK